MAIISCGRYLAVVLLILSAILCKGATGAVITEQLRTSEPKTNREPDVSIDGVQHITVESKNGSRQDQELKESRNNSYLSEVVCGGSSLTLAPSWVGAAPDWYGATDALDDFIISKTGCQYESLLYPETVSMEYSMKPQTGLRWRAALRARGPVGLDVKWAGDSGHYIELARDNATELYLQEGNWLRQELLDRRVLPALLAADRYTPVDLHLQAGCLSLEVGCGEGRLSLRHCDARLARASGVKVTVGTIASSGAKLLHTCPSVLPL